MPLFLAIFWYVLIFLFNGLKPESEVTSIKLDKNMLKSNKHTAAKQIDFPSSSANLRKAGLWEASDNDSEPVVN